MRFVIPLLSLGLSLSQALLFNTASISNALTNLGALSSIHYYRRKKRPVIKNQSTDKETEPIVKKNKSTVWKPAKKKKK